MTGHVVSPKEVTAIYGRAFQIKAGASGIVLVMAAIPFRFIELTGRGTVATPAMPVL